MAGALRTREIRYVMMGDVYRRLGKPAFDVLVGSALALVALPVIVLLALVSAFVFRAWPIFVQRRLGLRGQTFGFLKIRSMPVTVPDALDKHDLRNISLPAWGRFIRRTHLDETPQLLLVPLRRMSIVGPRPEMLELADRYPVDFLEARMSVRPGCTGLWQVSCALGGMIYEAPEYDLAYVANVTWRLDLWVLAKTVPAILAGRPIESLADVPASLLPVESSALVSADAAPKGV